jgi:hypothetical protein
MTKQENEAAAGPILETVPEIDEAAADISRIRSPDVREATLKAAAADARYALSRARVEADRDDEAAYERVFTPAKAEMLEALEKVRSAAEKVLTEKSEAAGEAFERAEFAFQLAKGRVTAINEAEAEFAYEATGDERKLGKLGRLGRRGRPRVVTNDHLAEISLPRPVTDRTRHNDWLRSLGMRAMGIKREATDPRGQVLEQFFLGTPGVGQKYRAGALLEIGRIADKFGNGAARKIGDEVYEKYRKSNAPPRTRDIVADIRNWRMLAEGRRRSSGEDGLYRKLTRLIEQHRKMYPDLTSDEIRMVMFRVQDDLQEEG